MPIAFDASVSGTGGTTSPRDHSHTVTGTDTILFVVTFSQGTVSGVTYNGVAMTSLGTYGYTVPTGNGTMWYLINPTTGTNTVSITHSGSFTIGVSASYTGAQQSGQPDATIQTNTSNSTTTLTNNITVVKNGSWLLTGGVWEGAGSLSAGSNTFLRQDGSNPAVSLFDSNGDQSPGSKSQTTNGGAAANMAIGTVSFAPSGGSKAISTLLLMGVG